ncbi:MAG: endonuclease [Planctomycetota bacterium]
MANQKQGSKQTRYEQILEAIFFSHYTEGATEFEFRRQEIEAQARELGIKLPKNIGDLVYTFRFRAPLPEKIRQTAPGGREWIIALAGRGRYRFSLAEVARIEPTSMLVETKVPDATPGVISMYALTDEQALLAVLRYNRLIDIFTHVTCYSLQNHLRTTVRRIGQIETDEIYVGVDRNGVHYVFPVQAKGGKDTMSIVQIQQDIEMCADKFPSLVCRAIGAQFMADRAIALFEFGESEGAIKIVAEKHYRLVPPDQLSADDLARYRTAIDRE